MASACTTLTLCSSLSSKCKLSSPNPIQTPFLSLPTSSSFRPFLSSSSSSRSSTFLPRVSDSTPAAPPILTDEPPAETTQVADVVVPPEQPNREEIFAVVMIGSRQYIVIPGRFIYIQRLKDAKVNDKIVLNKVLLVGTKTTTYIGKPIVTNAAVHAVVEEQGLNDKVIVFKYKRKKNYRRNIGHRQPNTRIRIKSITGYENFEATPNVDSI